MDDHRFDQLAKALAGAASRRSVLKGSAGAAVAGALALVRGSGAKAATNKVVICHKPGTAAEKTMEVASSAVSGHMGHGDRAGACTCPVDKVCGASNELCCVGDQVCQGGTTCGCPAELPELCDSGSGLCGACCSDAACDDGIPCTIDTCDRISGCQHTPDHAVCDDGNVCTDDICDPEVGCVPINNGAPCDDGDPCTENDVCVDGTCTGTPVVCVDDGSVCTDQVCDAENGGCISVNNSVPCDDGDACTVNDVCIDGACSPGTPVDCDDENICTVDSCDPELGCQHTPIPACPGSNASCGPDPDDPTCNCGEALDGSTVCFERFGCAGRPACGGDDECPEGQVCVVAPCCGTDTGNICVVPCGERIAPGESCTANAQCANGDCTCGSNPEAGHCQEPFFYQGFEVDTSGWYGVARVPSGSNGVPSSQLTTHHAEVGPHNGNSNMGFTRWGGYSLVFPASGYTTELDIYLNPLQPGLANDTRFDWTSAINGTGCAHLRDFAFNAGFYNDSSGPGAGIPRFVISASNNTGRSGSFPKNPGRTPIAIVAADWYTFRHEFRNVGGQLSVIMTVSSSAGVMGTWILGGDPIGTVSGNRYGWIANNELPFLAIDESQRSEP